MIKQSDLKMIKDSFLFQGLTEDELINVYENTQPRVVRFSKGDIVAPQGSKGKKIGLLKKGTVISTKYNIDGDAQVLALYKQKDVVGLESFFSQNTLSPSELSCQTSCEIGFITYSKLFGPKLLSNAKEKILFNSAKILSNEQIKLITQMEILSKKTLEKKIMTYLNTIREQKGTNTFDIHMNQSQFAQFLCVNRSVLSNELNYMRNEGLIDYDKSRYTILD